MAFFTTWQWININSPFTFTQVCTFLLSRNKILEEPAYSQMPEGTLGIEIGPRVMIVDRGKSNGVKQLQTFYWLCYL
jgi:hypothetical protein